MISATSPSFIQRRGISERLFRNLILFGFTYDTRKEKFILYCNQIKGGKKA